jgi:hypothetical protein
MLDHYKINPDTRSVYERIKDRIEFPKHYPKFYDFFVDKYVYILTYNRADNQGEFVIFKPDGKFLKKIMVPFYQTNMHVTYPHTIRDGKLYQLVENDDEEEWELYITPIK